MDGTMNNVDERNCIFFIIETQEELEFFIKWRGLGPQNEEMIRRTAETGFPVAECNAIYSGKDHLARPSTQKYMKKRGYIHFIKELPDFINRDKETAYEC